MFRLNGELGIRLTVNKLHVFLGSSEHMRWQKGMLICYEKKINKYYSTVRICIIQDDHILIFEGKHNA